MLAGTRLGLAEIRARYDWLASATPRQIRWYSGVEVGLEGGYTCEAGGGVAPQLLVAATYTTVAMGTDVFPAATMSATIVTMRAAVGVQF